MTNASTDLRLSREAYRQWAEAQPRGRFERIDGRVVAMAPERTGHADRKAMVWLALRRGIAEAGLACHAFPDGVTVEVGDSDYEPDAVVHCGPPLPPDRVGVPDPVIVVEVLPTATDRKLQDYFRLPSVRHYLIFAAEQPRLVHHHRDPRGGAVITQVATAGPIRLDPPGLTITMEEIYAG